MLTARTLRLSKESEDKRTNVHSCLCLRIVGWEPRCQMGAAQGLQPPPLPLQVPASAEPVAATLPDAGLDLLSVTDSEGPGAGEGDAAALYHARYGTPWCCAVAGLVPQLPWALPSQHCTARDGAQGGGALSSWLQGGGVRAEEGNRQEEPCAGAHPWASLGLI